MNHTNIQQDSQPTSVSVFPSTVSVWLYACLPAYLSGWLSICLSVYTFFQLCLPDYFFRSFSTSVCTSFDPYSGRKPQA